MTTPVGAKNINLGMESSGCDRWNEPRLYRCAGGQNGDEMTDTDDEIMEMRNQERYPRRYHPAYFCDLCERPVGVCVCDDEEEDERDG